MKFKIMSVTNTIITLPVPVPEAWQRTEKRDELVWIVLEKPFGRSFVWLNWSDDLREMDLAEKERERWRREEFL
jgi:hypothetical protein